ncbi:hypothetical protein FQA47_008335 [Oryzias melastigma]|uniref:Uncharacterized protein n=1 Tax=Oryzias melastigma TaxID=30732 RepID=A0A834CAD3_ORYME|nr:hypothetical protein FQA47_008335 [Oryzias melastigma]
MSLMLVHLHNEKTISEGEWGFIGIKTASSDQSFHRKTVESVNTETKRVSTYTIDGRLKGDMQFHRTSEDGRNRFSPDRANRNQALLEPPFHRETTQLCTYFHPLDGQGGRATSRRRL